MDRRGNETEAGYTDLLEIATPSGNPASGYLRTYAKSDGAPYTKNSAGTETKVGSTIDPILQEFGVADTAYEFDSSSAVGTAIGTATVEDFNTTVASQHYIKKAATAGTNYTGRYVAAPAAPFTAIAKISSSTLDSADNFQHYGILSIAEATPGKLESIYLLQNTGYQLATAQLSSPTGTVTNIDLAVTMPGKSLRVPFWLTIVVNSATSVDYWASQDGYVWKKVTAAHNPAFTIGSVAWGCYPENATSGTAALIDFVRIWNSVKTFLPSTI